MNTKKSALRIIDANLNRALEGLRILEEITRFVFNDKQKTASLKRIRHGVKKEIIELFGGTKVLLLSRNVAGDVGKEKNSPDEFKRNELRDIFEANFKRTEEALRVLEEFTKLFRQGSAQVFKKFRFKVYEIEKKLVLDFQKKN